MILLDANVLLYAHNSSSSHHQAARKWIEEAVLRGEELGLAWVTILAFLRIATNPAAFISPLSLAEAIDILESYLSRSHVLIVQPTTDHWKTLRDLALTTQANHHLITDAHLAALALEHDAAICTNDRDFSRFTGVKLVDLFQNSN